MPNPKKYNFSFTTSSLMLHEMVLIAESMRTKTEFNYVEILGNGKSATGKKYYGELGKRLRSLTADEINLLIDSTLPTQKQMCFLAVCKTFNFIKDFTLEVLRNKILVFDYQITEGDYISFFRGKTSLHDELEELTEQTQHKIKRVIFKILEQAGIIDSVKNKMIQPQYLEENVLRMVAKDHPDWLKIFLMSDLDIERVKL